MSLDLNTKLCLCTLKDNNLPNTLKLKPVEDFKTEILLDYVVFFLPLVQF